MSTKNNCAATRATKQFVPTLALMLMAPVWIGPHAVASDVVDNADALLTQADDTTQPVVMRAELKVMSVTLYRGRAAVTRSGRIPLRQGVYEIRVGPLPESADLDSVQASLGGSAKLLDVKSETVKLPAPSSDNPRVREALATTDAARARVADVTRRSGNNLAAQKTLDSIAAKAAADASQAIGSSLDPEKLRAQLLFLESERDRLTEASLVLATEARDAAGALAAAIAALEAAGGAPPIERFALITIAVPREGEIPLDVTYLVANASWKPSYTVRGDPEKSMLTLEFDAVVVQATGEDWKDVTLRLSTAQPTRAANPGAVEPTYIELYEPAPRSMPAVGSAAPMAPMYDARKERSNDMPGRPGEPGGAFGSPSEAGEENSMLAGLASDAAVGGTGPAVEYQLPRTFTATSDLGAERKTRVATLEATPSFTLVAQPLVESNVFLRARFRNESAYLLLPGETRMYLGTDSIGRATLAETPVGGEVELWFGKEPRVTARRELVSKKSSESGLFTKSTGIDREYRIVLENTLARAVDIEVTDRVPVSRDEAAKVELRDLTPALATDAKYLKDLRPQGVLKWALSLPPRAGGTDAKPVTLSWKTRISWPEGKIISGDVD